MSSSEILIKQLKNGLTIVAEPMRAAPVVAIQTWIDVGSADEEPEVAGVAHLHEHMLFKGTKKRGVGEIAAVVEASGGEINAWTSFDQTVYHVVIATEELGTGVDVLADALRNSRFDAEELAREIEVVVEEIQRAEDRPSRRIANTVFRLAYGNHPYARPVLGSIETVRAMTRDKLLGFYARHYRPEHTTVVATGDFQAEELFAAIEQSLGDWSPAPGKGSAPSRDAAPNPQDQNPGDNNSDQFSFELMREQVQEARIAMAWTIPGFDHPDIPALDALAVALGHGDSSRLYIDARQRQGLVNDVYAYAYTPKDNGLIIVGAGLAPEALDPALRCLGQGTFACAGSSVAGAITEAELEKARVMILSESAYLRETVQGQARKIGYFHMLAGDSAYEEVYRQRIMALTTKDLHDVAKRYLDRLPVTVVQIPEDATAPTAEQTRQLLKESRDHAHKPPTGAPLPPACDLGIHRIECPSGAILLLKPEDSPIVAIRATALGGQRTETATDSGAGSLFASMWGQSTADYSQEELSNMVAMLGGDISAFSGRNAIGLRAEFIAEKAKPGFELFANIFGRWVCKEDEVDRERDVLLERIANRFDNPAGVAFEEMAKTIFPTHPYGMRSIGTPESLATLSAAALTEYGQRFAKPERFVVSIAGGFDIDETAAFFSAMLNGDSQDLPQGDYGFTPPAHDQHLQKATEHHIDIDKEQCHILLGGMGTTIDDNDRYALEVINTVLSGQSGRLFLDLRDKQSLAYTVAASSVEGIDPGFVYVYMATSPDKLEQARNGLNSHLDRICDETVPESELERARRYLVGTYAIELQRAGARAMLTSLGERLGLGYAHFANYKDLIYSVTPKDIVRVSQKYLNRERLTCVVVGPRSPS